MFRHAPKARLARAEFHCTRGFPSPRRALPAAVALLAATLFACAAHAAQVTMKAEPDRREMTVDETLTLYVTLTFSERNVTTGNVEFPKNDDFEPQHTSYQEQIMLVNGALSVRKTTVFHLIPLRDGNLSIPPLRNFYIDPATGARAELETPPIDVAVKKVAEAPARKDDAPVEPAIPAGSPLSGTLGVILLTIAAIAAVSFAIARLLRRPDAPRSPVFDLSGGETRAEGGTETAATAEAMRRSAAAPPPPRAERTARDRAGDTSRERLALLAREDERAFAREISRLVKETLEEATSRPYAGKTSEEILGEMEYLRLGGEARELLAALLEYTDEISYCGGGGAVERRDRAVDQLRRLGELLKSDDRR